MTLLNDLRYAARQLRKTLAFTLTILLTLGLCIGANTAIYTVVDTLLFRSLPYPDPERLVMLMKAFKKNGASEFDNGQTGFNWELARDHATLVEPAVYGSTDGVNLYSQGNVEYIHQQRIGAGFFHVLGIPPLIGREFSRQEDVPNGPPLTILSYSLWQRLFGGDPSIVGRSVELRGEPYTIIGVMPPGFRSADDTGPEGHSGAVDLWTPLQPSRTGQGEGDNYGIIARLKPGVTLAAAQAQLASIMQPAFAQYHLPKGYTVEESAVPLQSGLTGDVRPRLHLMWGAAAVVLLIGCVNIAGILLSRSSTRSRELATRMAIGAGRTRIIRQLLAEAVLLAIGGGILGLVVGQLALMGLLQLNPQEFYSFGTLHLDLRVIAIMLALSLVTSLVFGLFPAFEATSVDLRSALSEAGRGAAGSRRQWRRQILVLIEVALGIMLVVSAGLLIRTLVTLNNLSPGFNPNHLMTASLSMQDARYQTTATGVRLYRDSLDRIRAIPGVESAAVALSLPYQRPLNLGVGRISGEDISRLNTIANFAYVTPDFFTVLQMPLRRGRQFTEADNAQAAHVAIVNEAFVRYFLRRHANALGLQVAMANQNWQIVGVTANVPQKMGWGGRGPLDSFPQVYIPAAQVPDGLFSLAHSWFSSSYVVRTRSDIAGLPEAMRRALESVDPRLPFASFHTIASIRGTSLRDQRYQATLFSAFAALALFLAALGVYGLIAQSVIQRTREMGIRLALGATVQQVMRAAVVPGITLSLAGTVSGLTLAIFATRLLRKLIWGVTNTDPLTFVSVAVLMLLIAALASIIPALRLTRLDPAQTLRDE